MNKLTLIIILSSLASFGQTNFYKIQKEFEKKYEEFKQNRTNNNQKFSGYKQYKRWEWYWSSRVNKDGSFPSNKSIYTEWKKEKLNPQLRSTSTTWQSLGPNLEANEILPGIGRVNCVEFHPTNPDIMWAGTPAGGIWKTTNGGESWFALADDLPVLGVSSIAVNPNDPDVIYIATGDRDRASSLSSFGARLQGDSKSIGLLKSIDGGSAWINILSAEQGEDVHLSEVLIDPNNSNRIIAATSSGIFVSTDAGSSWELPQLGDFIDIEFHPTNSSIIYATTLGNYYLSESSQFFMSSNSGVSFAQPSTFSGYSRIQIATSAANPNGIDLLCVNESNSGLSVLKYSNDFGLNWGDYYTRWGNKNLLGWYADGSDDDGQGDYDLAFAINPNNANDIFVGGINTWKSINAGLDWLPSSMWTSSVNFASNDTVPIVHADKHFLKYHPLVPNTIIECHDGGIAKSTDNGLTWTDITTGIVNSQFYSISASQTAKNVYSGGLQDNGSILKYNQPWEETTGGDGMKTVFNYLDSTIFYTSYVDGEIYRLDFNEGITTISENIPGNPIGSWLTPYTISHKDPNTLYAGYEDVYKTTDKGDTWEKISNLGFTNKIKYLEVSISNPNTIYIADQEVIYKTTNDGGSWDLITTIPSDLNVNISSIEIDPTDDKGLLVGLSGYEEDYKVLLTTDGGDSWYDLTLTGLPNLPVNCIESDNATGEIYLGTDIGVYFLDTVSSTWERYGEGLPFTVITDLEIQYTESKILAASFGRGLWQADINTTNNNFTSPAFSQNLSLLCINDCQFMTDLSSNAPTHWKWTFEGATPQVSYEQSPTVCYEAEGEYNVSLTTYSLLGGKTITKTNFVTVNNCITSFNAVELSNEAIIQFNSESNQLTVSIQNYQEAYQFQLVDISGKSVQQSQGYVNQVHELKGLKPGIYIANVSYNSTQINQKIIIK
jgi:photosystem II stability/assembly factor-like uncharacterized protein